MPFKKGHKGHGGGRKKGSKKNSSLDVHKNPKQWKKSPSKSTLDIEQVDYYIYNGLDITELYDELKLYDYKWKNKNGNKNV